MADNFKRLLAATIPTTFARNGYSNDGRVRIYSVGEGGILLGNSTTTWGYGLDGTLGGQRARSAGEAQWGIPTGYYAPASRPVPVGRLSTGHTLYSVPGAPTLISTPSILRAGDTGLELPGLTGRYYVSCCMTGDGSHVLIFTRATAGSSGASAEQWHLMQWLGSHFTLVREGEMGIEINQYRLGPGSSAADNFGCAMLERDLTTLWLTYLSEVAVYRIGADNVFREVKKFVGAEGLPNDFSFASIYADRGLAAVVAGNGLWLFQSRDPDPIPEPYMPPQFDVGLRQVSNGVFDLDWFQVIGGDDGPSVQTLVYAALFTDAEAPAAREPDRYLRRGWWRDPSAGSGLWHIRRQPLGSTARREAVEAVRGALEAYGLTDVSVTERGPVGVSSVVLEVSGLYRDRPFLVSVPL
jgi:hypothetical protein